MRILAELHDHDAPSMPPAGANGYATRHAARAILLNDRHEVALLHVRNGGYHKLPGGGVEAGEDALQALRREVREETGCDIIVLGEVGRIVEWRHRRRQLHTSDCWLVSQTGSARAPAFTARERASGFVLVWYESLSAALDGMSEDRPKSYDGQCIVRRDLLFLRAAAALR